MPAHLPQETDPERDHDPLLAPRAHARGNGGAPRHRPRLRRRVGGGARPAPDRRSPAHHRSRTSTWVITAYNLALIASTLAVLPRRPRARVTPGAGGRAGHLRARLARLGRGGQPDRADRLALPAGRRRRAAALRLPAADRARARRRCPALMGDGRRGRGRGRPGGRGSAHPDLRLARDLLRPGPGRRAGRSSPP